MGNLLIVKPLTVSAISGGGTTASRLLTPDPKEAWAVTIANGGGNEVHLDYGAPVSLDTVLFGFSNLPSGAGFTASLYTATDGTFASFSLQASANPTPSLLATVRRHFLFRLAAPVTSRYWIITLTNTSGASKAVEVGVLAAGLAFAPTWGQEMGAGRPIEDTSTVERLFGGGFGTDLGAIMGGYQWTLGDLSKAEIAALYAMMRDLGTSRDCLLIEDMGEAPTDNESIHWGKFGKLDVYERNSPVNWKWPLAFRDWA